ncbi:macro domain-containing protein [Anaerococcus sp. AGMB00486]|uniref:Macro domain-containing protein n=2 Tax=Anaerococcus TaxID=165779 RepID=A0ABX2NBB6_9FIRM|nr:MULTISPECIES: macro domain-containing protein [Anaerococcus]MDY3006443.1 macro domain-containing protein [Anaerococcus porci]MSS78244.1 macro domain-containing protein [Anaerococcus porci]NVF12002.1 macro domain-containing protein [Anaerococcus faecalis]
MTLQVINKDILKLNVDAIVNAANIDLLEGGGICGQIFRAAGRKDLKKACDKLSPIKTGQAVITDGFNLKQKYIIHTAGPIYNEIYKEVCRKLLEDSYMNSLKLAKENNIKSIAFPLISTGIYAYPLNEAFMIARNTIEEFLHDNEMEVYLSILGNSLINLIMS